MTTTAILYFRNREILLVHGVQTFKMHQHAKFRQNQLIGCEILRFFLFFKMAAVRHLDLFGAYWDHPHRILGGLYHSAKFGYN